MRDWHTLPLKTPAVSRNSAFDNLRPVIPKWDDRRTAIVWMRGAYLNNHGEWYSSMVAAILPPSRP